MSVEERDHHLQPPGLRALWQQERSPLPAVWHQHYPLLFVEEDLRLGLPRY